MTEANDDSPARGLRARLEALRRADTEEQVYVVGSVVLVTLFALVALHAIGTLWVWGHNGFNGAAFAQAARNSLRFGMAGQAQYYMGLEPPPATEIYTHHPMALHAHLVALFAILGDDAWVARLVPAAYSVACLVMLLVAARRWFGPTVALTAGFVWALTPLNLIFANMVNHEQGGIFWCLFYVHCYLLWLHTYERRHFVAVMVGVTMAVQFDWPGYYIALFVVLHAFFRGLRLQEGWFGWRPEFTFVLVFSVVVLANFALFYSFIVDTRGDFTEMQSAFDQRSSSPDDYWARMQIRMPDMHTTGFLGILALWVASLPVLIAKRRIGVALLFPLCFLGAQTVHSLVFKEAGYIHVYWTWFLNPAMAVGVAFVLVSAARAPAALLASSLGRRLRGGVPATSASLQSAIAFGFTLFVVAPLAWQARVAWERLNWGVDTGSASYHDPYVDNYEVARFIRVLTDRYDRDNSDFWLHTNLDLRIETLYYLDAPYRMTRTPRLTPSQRDSGRHQVFVADLTHAQDWSAIERMVREHDTLVYDERFLAVDLASTEAGFESWVSTPRTELLWSWFVQPHHPDVDWNMRASGDEGRDALLASFNDRVVPPFGGETGNIYSFDCPDGDALTALILARRESGGSPILSGAIADCGDVARDGEDLLVGQERTAESIVIGAVARETGREQRCREGEAIVGIHGTAGSLVDSLGIVCAPISVSETDEGWAIAAGTGRRRPVVGVRSGFAFDVACPSSAIVTGINVRGGALVDAFGITCTPINAAWCGDQCVDADTLRADAEGSGAGRPRGLVRPEPADLGQPSDGDDEDLALPPAAGEEGGATLRPLDRGPARAAPARPRLTR